MSDKAFDSIRAIRWQEDHLQLLDQRLLPRKEVFLDIHTVLEAQSAIRDMVVRGAPAIGITVAYGAVLSAQHRFKNNPRDWWEGWLADLQALGDARPTAVNAIWAVKQMQRSANNVGDDSPVQELLNAAREIHQNDIEGNYRMGELGQALFEENCSVITHCNTGALATGGYGTALGVIRAAAEQGKIAEVFADETRPWLQGSRLTAWELKKEGIPARLIADSAAAAIMRQGKADCAIVGADRIAANGDVANKIGTYSLAVSAKAHGIPFYVAAPVSTIDMYTVCGDDIEIEIRAQEELLQVGGQNIAASGTRAYNPVFDITPAELIDVIITDKGIVRRPDKDKIRRLMNSV